MIFKYTRHPRVQRRVEAVEMFWNLVTDKYHKYHASHIVMALIIILYSLFGAVVFVALEDGNEKAHIQERHRTAVVKQDIARNGLITEMQYIFFRYVNITALHQRPFQEILDRYDAQMNFKLEADKKDRIDMIYEKSRWDIWGGLYYSITLYTTIGYGDIAARTFYGRLFTIFYAIGGIPLVITVLNIWGGGLFELMQSIWNNYIMRCVNMFKSTKKRKPVAEYDEFDGEFGDDACVDLLEKKDEFEIQKPQLPLQLALFVFVLWIGLCTVVFMLIQKWDFFTALYYCAISLTTIGLGDITVSHQIGVISAILIMLGLSVVSMSINIIQLHIEYVFAKIIKSIDNDFKRILVEERRKMSIATSMSDQNIVRKNTSTVLSIPVPTLEEQEDYRRRSTAAELNQEDVDAIRKYASSMSVMDKMLVQLMSSHQKKMLNERVAEKNKMRNKYTQTDEKKISTAAQTENGKNNELGGFVRTSMISTDSESEEEDNTPVGANLMSSPSAMVNIGVARPGQNIQRPQRKRGLSRKKLYIYNIGD
ncbi:unnamed protein product [Bursaphelenchus okinawaensis]|uniref:Potassium channel domain-containing protein n=1 Tax=Bursaphelenchus okinawaensis TaxID=465554 RepID=A0A811L7S3_9BILA|nr:unnamed protein product [Bursaphelenchus okinawaensis]CAG9118260.1 unnamed protein product [Bursaphelenchus okinawaensis]